ncbi:aldo/keto reductase [Murimonas intestini]|uniref:aldo/keto reductase n=1 Tax=Murimonas intestini TaxID=1337051 RepID=UPI0011DCC130|nr:aldo/keto reductase [Murimonas intestini]
MTKRKLGNTGYEIAPVVYGGIVSMSDGQEASDQYVEYAINKGINYFDVAPSYGDAQEKLGNSLKPYRKDIYLACKTNKRLAAEGERELDESLRLLHTDYFDNYQMHGLATMEELEAAFGKGGVMEIMIRAKEKGITRKLGITCHDEDVALKAISLYDFDTVLFPLNWGINMGKEFGSRISRAAKERNIGLLGMKTLIHRAWINDDEKHQSRFPKSWCKPISENEELGIAAIKYTLSMGADAVVPPGNFESFSFVTEHIEECLANPLNDKDMALLEKELKKIDGHYFF